MKSLIISILCLLLTSVVCGANDPTDPDLIAKMRQAPNMLAQNKLITEANGWIYNFSTNAQYSLSPGSVCNAHTVTFPAMTGLPMTIAQLNLGPCAMLPPHLHRFTNAVVAVAGTTRTYMVQENGADTVETKLSQGLMTIFPAASVHWMVNEGCDTNKLYSFLAGEDPGTLNVGNTVWQLGADIGNHILSLNINHDDWATLGKKIPTIGTGSIIGYESCLKQCGMKRSAQPSQSGYIRVV